MKPPRSAVHRRDLLRSLRGQPATATARAPGADRSGRSDLIRARRAAMGSYFEVRLPASAPWGVDLATRALDVIDRLEAQMTVYRDDSELSRINATAHLGPVEVEPGLFALLERAIAIGRETGGAYDVAAGALSVAWGFFKGPRRVPDPDALEEARERTGAHHLRLDPESRTVAFDRPGIVVNLGGIGKGYAIDRAVAVIRDHWWPTPAIVHGGQSSLYALGSPPDRLGGRWEVALRNPTDPARPLGTIRLRNRGLGTSGDSFQRFEAGGRSFGHILDPRTGEPPDDGPATVTVLAPSAAEADALSTAFSLLDREQTARYIASHPGVGALIVPRSPGGAPPRVIAMGLSPDDFEPGPGCRCSDGSGA